MKTFYGSYFVFLIVVLIGWGLNIYKLIGMLDQQFLGNEFILRIVGAVFVPLGAIMGYFV